MFGNRGNTESREQTIANGEFYQYACFACSHILPSEQEDSASRNRAPSCRSCVTGTLAVEYKFTKGWKSMNVVTVCLCVAYRQKETRNYMLIDFSDLLQVRPSFSPFHPFPCTSTHLCR